MGRLFPCEDHIYHDTTQNIDYDATLHLLGKQHQGYHKPACGLR